MVGYAAKIITIEARQLRAVNIFYSMEYFIKLGRRGDEYFWNNQLCFGLKFCHITTLMRTRGALGCCLARLPQLNLEPLGLVADPAGYLSGLAGPTNPESS